jgi:hypothetical protein
VSIDDYNIMLMAPMVIENLLCCELDYKMLEKHSGSLQMQGSIVVGNKQLLHEVDVTHGNTALLKITVPGYDWSNAIAIEAHPQNSSGYTEAQTHTLKLLDDKQRPLNLYAHVKYDIFFLFLLLFVF